MRGMHLTQINQSLAVGILVVAIVVAVWLIVLVRRR
jgi:hypothetical protein